jgi:hypothetical protein
MEEKPKPYQPYAPDTRDGSNNIRENTGAGATKEAPLNGWPWDEKTGNKGGNQ